MFGIFGNMDTLIKDFTISADEFIALTKDKKRKGSK
jgi:hypothetical protein